jgi:hypothetical protein
MDVSTINQSIEQLTNILLLSAEQSTQLTEKLIKVNVEQKLRGVNAEHLGTIIDTYA